MRLVLLSVLADVSAKPDPAGLPGSSVAEKLINGLFFYTLLGCLAGGVVVVLRPGAEHPDQHADQQTTGRQGTIVAAGGALIAGAAPALINFFQALGTQVK